MPSDLFITLQKRKKNQPEKNALIMTLFELVVWSLCFGWVLVRVYAATPPAVPGPASEALGAALARCFFPNQQSVLLRMTIDAQR